MFAGALLLLGCEDDTREVNASPRSSMSHSNKSNETGGASRPHGAPTSSYNANQDRESQDLWRVIIEAPDSSDTNWVVKSSPETVDVNIFMMPEGFYMVDEIVFTNCDEVGFYLISREGTDALLVTNCRTSAFP